MGAKAFDTKFGPDLLPGLPTTPAIYLFKDEQGAVLYVGKAKNLRRRLQAYRNASRKKAHRKMRTLVREAATLEVRTQSTEQAALLAENELIRTLKPPYNVDGSYSFLYPAIGVRLESRQSLLCFTTSPEAWGDLDLAWYGTYRSRLRAKESFEALIDLLVLVGHQEPRANLPARPPVRGSRLVGIRQLDRDLMGWLPKWLAGDSDAALKVLSRALVERPRARRDAAQVQANLEVLADFYQSDLVKLRDALSSAGQAGTFVAQDQRDALFISARTA